MNAPLVYINPQDTALTTAQQAWLRQTTPVRRELVSPLKVAEAADRRLAAQMGMRATVEARLLDLVPEDDRDTLERLAPLDRRRAWVPVDEMAQESLSEAVTPQSEDEVRAGLRCLSPKYRDLPPARQMRVAQQVCRQARRAEAEERLSSLAAADAVLDEGWTTEKAAAVRGRRQAASAEAWARDELAILNAAPDGRRLAEVERRMAEAGLAGSEASAVAAARSALSARAQQIADGLSAQAQQAVDKAILFEIANAALLAGDSIGADVSALVQPAVTRREAELAAQAAQAAAAEAARADLAALKAAPDGARLADITRRLRDTGLADEWAADLADARRALRERAFALALAARPAIRAAVDLPALELAEQAARQSGASVSAEALVMEYVARDIARRRRELQKNAARQRAIIAARQANVQTGNASRPAPLDKAAEAAALLAELRRRNPRVVMARGRCLRFHGLTRAEQEKFAAQVVSLQQQIQATWRKNGPIVVRERGRSGLRTIRAAEFAPGAMRLVGLDWLARRMDRDQPSA